MSFQKWPQLKKGDLIDIVAPGSAAPEEQIQEGLEVLKSWGVRVRWNPSQQKPDEFCSASVQDRLRYLKKALYAKDSQAVWCVRGGYGSLHLIPEMLTWARPKRAKLLLGYSDISSLHLFLSQHWKWVSCHGPLIEGLRPGRMKLQHVQELKYCLFGQEKEVSQDLEALNALATKRKFLSGRLAGGNLTTLVSHCGTSLSPKWRSQIVLFEEIAERGYRVDRLLNQALQSGSFVGVRAVIFGDFIGGAEKDGRELAQKAIQDFAKKVSFPVLRGLEMGHGESNRPWFIGAEAELRLGKNPQLLSATGVQIEKVTDHKTTHQKVKQK
jgi:muramoyltetrapeptide carboxypeptidase